MARLARAALVGGISALWWIATLTAIPAAPPSCPLERGERHDVGRVVDGETLLLDDGRQARLIGALAAPAQGAETRRMLEALIGSGPVELGYEGRRQDRYGRVLAQVFALGGTGTDRNVWLQEALVRAGQARAYSLPGNGACLRDLLAAEDEARRAKRGLWARDTHRVRAASETASLLALAGQFAIVEGRIADVGRSARTIYLNFGSDWRRDFTASLGIARKASARPAGGGDEDGERAQRLAGHTVRVRGWIERRNGPLIALGSLDEVEVLDGSPENDEAPR